MIWAFALKRSAGFKLFLPLWFAGGRGYIKTPPLCFAKQNIGEVPVRAKGFKYSHSQYFFLLTPLLGTVVPRFLPYIAGATQRRSLNTSFFPSACQQQEIVFVSTFF